VTRTGSGRGKLILFGEHAAVYGYPAVGVSLPCRTTLTFESAEGESCPSGPALTAPGAPLFVPGKVLTPGESAEDRELFLNLLHDLSFDSIPDFFRPEGVWRRVSDVPLAGGFGSSAAFCVAISRIVLGRTGEQYCGDVHRLANALEHRFHGTPSGIDTGMACDTGSAVWRSSPSGLPGRQELAIPAWHVIYGALPRTSSTAATVGDLKRRIKSGDAGLIRTMNDLGTVSEDFIKLVSELPEDFPDRAAPLVNLAQGILAGMNLSVPELDRLLDIAVNEGAGGGKLSGGGAGGAFFICAPDVMTRNRLLEILPGRLEDEGIGLPVKLTALDFPAGP
jgi:mevalonate kinase